MIGIEFCTRVSGQRRYMRHFPKHGSCNCYPRPPPSVRIDSDSRVSCRAGDLPQFVGGEPRLLAENSLRVMVLKRRRGKVGFLSSPIQTSSDHLACHSDYGA